MELEKIFAKRNPGRVKKGSGDQKNIRFINIFFEKIISAESAVPISSNKHRKSEIKNLIEKNCKIKSVKNQNQLGKYLIDFLSTGRKFLNIKQVVDKIFKYSEGENEENLRIVSMVLLLFTIEKNTITHDNDTMLAVIQFLLKVIIFEKNEIGKEKPKIVNAGQSQRKPSSIFRKKNKLKILKTEKKPFLKQANQKKKMKKAKRTHYHEMEKVNREIDPFYKEEDPLSRSDFENECSLKREERIKHELSSRWSEEQIDSEHSFQSESADSKNTLLMGFDDTLQHSESLGINQSPEIDRFKKERISKLKRKKELIEQIRISKDQKYRQYLEKKKGQLHGSRDLQKREIPNEKNNLQKIEIRKKVEQSKQASQELSPLPKKISKKQGKNGKDSLNLQRIGKESKKIKIEKTSSEFKEFGSGESEKKEENEKDVKNKEDVKIDHNLKIKAKKYVKIEQTKRKKFDFGKLINKNEKVSISPKIHKKANTNLKTRKKKVHRFGKQSEVKQKNTSLSKENKQLENSYSLTLHKINSSIERYYSFKLKMLEFKYILSQFGTINKQNVKYFQQNITIIFNKELNLDVDKLKLQNVFQTPPSIKPSQKHLSLLAKKSKLDQLSGNSPNSHFPEDKKYSQNANLYAQSKRSNLKKISSKNLSSNYTAFQRLFFDLSSTKEKQKVTRSKVLLIRKQICRF